MSESTSTNPDAGCLKPGEVIKPSMSAEQVPKLILDVYGLVTSTIKSLVSYDDLNFLIKVSDSTSTNPYIKSPSTVGYVLKVLNSMDSQNQGLVEGQNAMMLHLHHKGYNCPAPQKTVAGDYLSMQQFSEDSNMNPGKQHIVRLLSFVPSKILDSVALTQDLCYDAGSYIARLQQDLLDFSHVAIAERKFIWMMSETPSLRQFMSGISDPDRKALVTRAIDAWEQTVLPAIDTLPKGYIHGDFNEQNILVTATESTKDLSEPVYTVSGVIDFGDVNCSCYVFELSILVMSVLTMNTDCGAVAENVIAGYCSRRPLQELEWTVLYECVCARLGTSLTMGAYSYAQDPSNSYLLTTAKEGWRALQCLLTEGKVAATQRWKDGAAAATKARSQ